MNVMERQTSPEVAVATSPAVAVSPPVSLATSVRGEDPLRVFVNLLMVRIFYKCNTLDSSSQEHYVARIKHLVNQTMKGLALSESFSFDARTIQSVCRAVLRDLKNKFSGKYHLEAALLSRVPWKDTMIVRTLQDHIRRLAEKLLQDKPLWQRVLAHGVDVGSDFLMHTLSLGGLSRLFR